MTYVRHSERVLSDVIAMPHTGGEALNFLLIPNLRDARIVAPDRPHDPSEVHDGERFSLIKRRRTFYVSTNRLGLRGPELSESKQGPRILCVGDSVTFGWGVADNQSFPARLADILDVEVVNGGIPALQPPDIATNVRRLVPILQPDLVLFTRRPDYRTPDPWGTYQQAVQDAVEAARPAPVALILPPVSTFDPMGMANDSLELRRIRSMNLGIPILDLTPAYRAALPMPGITMEIADGQQRVIRWPEQTEVLSVPAPAHGLAPAVTELFESDTAIKEPLFFDGGHPDAAGLVLFAETVADFIAAEGLLPGTQQGPGARTP
jgi:lysophospholipase L1-like esterase